MGRLCGISGGGRGCVGEERRLSLGEEEVVRYFLQRIRSLCGECLAGTLRVVVGRGEGRRKMRTCIDGFG